MLIRLGEFIIFIMVRYLIPPPTHKRVKLPTSSMSFYTSYATRKEMGVNACIESSNNCFKSGNKWCWNGIYKADPNGIAHCTNVCANSCSDARQAFLNKYGAQDIGAVDNPGDVFFGGKSTTPTKVVPANSDTKSSKFNNAVGNTLTDDGCGGKGVNPASGCCNCGSDWDLGTVSCNLFGKPSCEFQAYTRNGLKGLLDNSGKFLSDNLLFVAAGIGGILVITLLLTRR